MKKKNAFQMLLIIVFSLICFIFAYLTVQEGLLISRQTAEISTIEAMIGQQQEVLRKMKDAEAKSAELEAQLMVLREMIPDGLEQNRFLVWIQQISSDASMKLTDVSFDEHVQEDGYMLMPLTLSMQGSYKGLLKLLSELMYNKRLVRVDDIDLTENNGILNIEIKANLFYRK